MFFTREETIQYRIPEDGKPVSANSIAAGVVKKIMDNYIHSLHWKTFLILTAGLFVNLPTTLKGRSLQLAREVQA